MTGDDAHESSSSAAGAGASGSRFSASSSSSPSSAARSRPTTPTPPASTHSRRRARSIGWGPPRAAPTSSRSSWSGARISIVVGFAAAIISAVIGAAVGLLSGYFGGWTDRILDGVDNWFLVIPTLPLMIVLSSILAPSLGVLILVIGITSWAGTGRIVRSQVLTLRERAFVERARALGASHWYILQDPHLPQRAAADLRQHRADRGRGDPVGVGPGLPRAGRPDADLLGHDAGERLLLGRAERRGMVVRDPARACASRCSSSRSPSSATCSRSTSTQGCWRQNVTPLLEVSDLHVHAGDKYIVDGVDLELQHGEALGLAGESGCGKTTTALALMKLLPGGLEQTGKMTLNLKGADEPINLERRTETGHALRPLAPHLAGLPGRDELPRPGAEGRGSVRGGDPAALALGRLEPRCSERTRGAAGHGGADGGARAPLRPPALGRPAPAGDDRPRARVQPVAGDRRRADDSARRGHAGAGPPAARASARATGPGADPDLPRPGGAGRDVRPHRRDVRGADRRDRARRNGLLRSRSTRTRSVCWRRCRRSAASGAWRIRSPAARRTRASRRPGCRFRPRCPYAGDRCGEDPALREVKPGHGAACHYAPWTEWPEEGLSEAWKAGAAG